jgi:hypothetical protein
MFKTKIVNALKNRVGEKPKKDALHVATKNERQKRLSSQEFLKGYDIIYQAGPQIKYQNPGVLERESQLINKKSNLFNNNTSVMN